MAVSLKHQTITGVFWNFLELFLRRGVTGLTTLVLAWFLVPKDFGLVSMMTVFLAFSHVIVDGGMKQGLIRKQDVTQTEYSTAFYANLACALMI
ncbi:MAG: oligosaccharide flippase family protein, partial [Methylomicrobium sp.]|nr:oligosaccharide flippase family protein [Methylomicrobium sp.]